MFAIKVLHLVILLNYSKCQQIHQDWDFINVQEKDEDIIDPRADSSQGDHGTYFGKHPDWEKLHYNSLNEEDQARRRAKTHRTVNDL